MGDEIAPTFAALILLPDKSVQVSTASPLASVALPAPSTLVASNQTLASAITAGMSVGLLSALATSVPLPNSTASVKPSPSLSTVAVKFHFFDK